MAADICRRQGNISKSQKILTVSSRSEFAITLTGDAAMAAAVNGSGIPRRREKIEIDPVAGAEVEAIIRNAYAALPEVLTRLNEAIKPPR
jgi:hypothetical protein